MAVLPDFGAATFDPEAAIDNPFFPLTPGTLFDYEAEEDDGDDDDDDDIDDEMNGDIDDDIDDEMNGDSEEEDGESEQLIVTFETRDILGVTAQVVRSVEWEDGILVEDGFDWYAQDTEGNVWYLGELDTEYEYDDEGNFIGTSNDGWEAGVDGAEPGYIMLANPQVGDRYFQEFVPGISEDEAEVISLSETISIEFGDFENVLQIRESSALEADEVELAYYAAGVGQILEEEIPEDGEDPEIPSELDELFTFAEATLPALTTATFENSANIDNPLLPLTPGTLSIYEATEVDEDTGETEVELDLVFVTDATRDILGISTRVVREVEFEDGQLVEDELVYYAQDTDGNVWVLGDRATEYEYSEDSGELLEIETEEWLAGTGEILPGYEMLAAPEVGDTYFELFELDEEEDRERAEVLSVSESVSLAIGDFENVVQIRETSSEEPEEFELAYYAPGVGSILEEEIEEGEIESASTLVETLDLGETELPNFAGATFENSANIDNPLFPLTPGTLSIYEATEVDEDTGETEVERGLVFVTDATRDILGISTRVVREAEFENGQLVEDELVYYAQDTDGNVWVLGDLATEYEYSEDGGELLEIETEEWLAGTGDTLPGYEMLAAPEVGDTYFELFELDGDEREQAEVLSVTESVSLAIGDFENVVQIRETSSDEPEEFELAYYAPGVGSILEEEIEEGELESASTLIETLDLGETELPNFVGATFAPGAAIDNPFFPLTPGTVYDYEIETVDEDTGEVVLERNEVFVTSETREILGVETRIVQETEIFNGLVVEESFEWYAQDTEGNVWYFGEFSTDFEYDEEGNLIETDTSDSWEAGVGGALPGILVEANPQVGDRYYQEFALGVAEDEAEVVGVGESLTTDLGSFENVLRIQGTEALEPDEVEIEYYAPGVGLVLVEELNSEGEVEEVSELVGTGVNNRPIARNDRPLPGSEFVVPGIFGITTNSTANLIEVLANDSDPDGDDLTLSLVSQPRNGTAAIDDNGTPANPNDDVIVYTSDSGFAGQDRFKYQIDDGKGGIDTATVVVAVNAPVIAEMGRIEGLTDAPQTINLQHDFVDPVVIVQPLSRNGGQAAIARFTELDFDTDTDSFTVRVQETNASDGNHVPEEASYLVVEKGTWQLDDGSLLEVGSVEIEGEAIAGFDTVPFAAPFAEAPAVFSQVQTNNDTDFVRTRQQNATASGFEVALEEEEALAGVSDHEAETVGYLAIASGAGTWSGQPYFATTTGETLTGRERIGFEGTFVDDPANPPAPPQVFAALNSYNDPQPAGLRTQSTTAWRVDLRVEEDRSSDGELARDFGESASLLAIQGANPLLEATVFDSDAIA